MGQYSRTEVYYVAWYTDECKLQQYSPLHTNRNRSNLKLGLSHVYTNVSQIHKHPAICMYM